MHPIEVLLGLGGAAIGALSLMLLIVAAVISLFKIEEADRYYGVGKLGGKRLFLKGLPFSLGRMAEYGLVILFSRTRYVRKKYSCELDLIDSNAPPKRLRNLLVWLYASWFISGSLAMIAGSAVWLLF
ncbi:MAG TPA: hypothetical protein VFM75_06155 [Modicisalibacter sp.]|nr:hypothetical protein [Modicisalibacter sp.]